MRVLITGGLGVNGSWVVRRLVEEGDEPIVFDLAQDTSLLADLVERVEVVKGDILSQEVLVKCIEDHSVEAIIHMAALVSPQATSLDPRIADPLATFDVNAKGTLHVLEAAKVKGIRRVVYTSSKGVYGRIGGPHGPPEYLPLKEDHPKRPLSLYDATKLFGEHLGEVYSRLYGLEFVALRFAHIYGPGRLVRHGGLALYDRMVHDALKGVPTRLEGGAEARDDLIYVKDVARAIVLALKAELKEVPRAYNIGWGRVHSLLEFVKVLKELLPEADVKVGPGKELYGSIPGVQCALDSSLAREELGFEPHYDLRRGLEDYIAWIKGQKGKREGEE